MMPYLKQLTVMYTSHDYAQPDEIVWELQGDSSNINYGFDEGKFIWLHPEWHEDGENSVTNFTFEKSETEIKNYNDLALNAGGDYRYIKSEFDGKAPVTKVGLYRTSEELSTDQIRARIVDSGYTGFTSDINEGRGGDYLYLVWAY